MVRVRSGKRTSIKKELSDVDQPSSSLKKGITCGVCRTGHLVSKSRSVYDIPSCSSDDSICVYPKLERLNLEVKQTPKSRTSPGNTGNSNGSLKSPLPKRFRKEQPCGALLLREALELAFPSEKMKSPGPQPTTADRDTSSDRLKSPKKNSPRGANSLFKQNQTTTNAEQLRDTASAPPARNFPLKRPRYRPGALEHVQQGSASMSELTPRRHVSEGRIAEEKEFDIPEDQNSSKSKTKIVADPSILSPKRPLTPKSVTKSPKSSVQRARKPNTEDISGTLEALEPATLSSLTPTVAVAEEIPRSVRFRGDDSNEIHIIPAVETTLPFAVQMAMERYEEAQEIVHNHDTDELLTEDLGEENVIPKCSRVVIGQRYIAIDRFVRKDECRYHFLTHAHVDHIVNLSKSWKSPIYCSEMTAKILTVVLGKRAPSSKLLRPLKVGESHLIEPNLLVTVLDAHHCLGSAMFLFEGASIPGGSVLCTGDFRADSEMLARFDSDPSFKKLAETSISKIYLDNTYLEHGETDFPERTESTKMLISEVEKLHDCSILIPVFKLGREQILEKLSQHFSEPILTSSERLAIRKVYGLNSGEFTDVTDTTARIRTSLRQTKNIFAALKKMTHPTVVIDISVRDEYKEILKENLITIPYSDHSSCNEIHAFLSRLRYGEIVPTSAPMQISTAEKLMKLSREMIHASAICSSGDDIQKPMDTGTAELGEAEAITAAPSQLKINLSSLRPATDTNIFTVQGVNLLDFCEHTDPRKFTIDPPRSGPIKARIYDVFETIRV